MERIAKDASLAKKSRVAQGKSTQVKVNPKQRVNEFPEEMLVVSAGKLYCEACHTVIALKKSIVKDHIMSSRHIAGKEDANTKKVRQQRVVASWEKYEKDHAGDLWNWSKFRCPARSKTEANRSGHQSVASRHIAGQSRSAPATTEGGIRAADILHSSRLIHSLQITRKL